MDKETMDKIVNGEAAPETAKTVDYSAEKATVRAEIDNLVSQYNDSAAYSEFKIMKELEAKISGQVEKYSELAEAECFAEILAAKDPMLEAVKRLTYTSVKVRDVKDEGVTTRTVEDTEKQIDPLRLHKKAGKDGIGADKNWHLMIEKLNKLMTCARAIELGIDPKDVDSSYSMSEEAAKIECLLSETDPTKYDKNKADEVLLADVQKVVEAMIGAGYSVTEPMVQYLKMVYTKKDTRKSLGVVCANHKQMRTNILEVAHAAVTGDEFTLRYKKKK